MQARFEKPLEIINYTHSAAVTGGQVIIVNSKPLVALADYAASTLGAYYQAGSFEFVKDSSNLSSVFTAVYWDEDGDPVGGTAGTGALTSTSSGNIFVGYNNETAGAGVGSVSTTMIRPPATVTVAGALTTAIADPGASGAIPVTVSGYVPIVTAGSETRTLAAPTFIGQELLIYMKTDGGNCVITCSTTLNETGNNTITFADTGDCVRLICIEDGADKRWRLTQADGHTLSTV